MAAPTFVTDIETAWNTTTSPKTTSTFSVQAGDILVATAINAHSAGATTITIAGGSLTWTLIREVDVNNHPALFLWTATVDSDKSMDVTFTRTAGPTDNLGAAVLQFRSSDGVGNSNSANATTSAPSVSVTTTQADSAIVTVNADWNALTTSRTARTGDAGAFTETTYDTAGGAMTVYIGYHANSGAVAAKAVGWSAPAGQDYVIAAVEIKGTAGGGGGRTTRNTRSHPLGIRAGIGWRTTN